MNAFELLLWSLLCLVLIRLLRSGDSRLWLLVGLLVGLGLLNKLTLLAFAFGLLVGLLLTRHWRWLLGWHFWLGAACGTDGSGPARDAEPLEADAETPDAPSPELDLVGHDIGPMERLVGLGQWLDANHEAIFATRPRERASHRADRTKSFTKGGFRIRTWAKSISS